MFHERAAILVRELAALCFCVLLGLRCAAGSPGSEPRGQIVAIGTFDIDATPPVGSMMAYDRVTHHWDLGLRAKGIVLVGAGSPIVLCAIDWIGIANEAHDRFREKLAAAAGTSPDRVAVHTLHQHDAPDCDFAAERILKDAGLDALQFEGTWQRQFLSRLAASVGHAATNTKPVTHYATGSAPVHQVASNRRILGLDGMVRAVRYTACKDEGLRSEPEGTIDPVVSLLSFWAEDKPLAVLSYYATHPQSYYRTGVPNPDFPGLARFLRQLAVPAALHVHFTGAAGNIGAGKYNDGAPENRQVLAQRLADGMKRAWESSKRERLTPEQIGWDVAGVKLPLAKDIDKNQLIELMTKRDARFMSIGGPTRLAWARRVSEGHSIPIACFRVGSARVLHMPGELFVEYQLAAKAVRPDLFVAMAAYGDYGPWYIGTAKAYEEGGYETTPPASNVGSGAEKILLGALESLLKK